MNQIERLSPDLLLPEMQRWAEDLLAVIIEKRKSLGNAPAGRLRVAIHGKQWHCYHVVDSANVNGVYIPKSDLKFIKRLAQKDYDASVLKEMERELSLIENFLKAYGSSSIPAMLEKVHVNRRSFIEPIQLTDEEYAARWLAQSYKGKPFNDEAEFLTSNGERVRSKSEMIIADMLAKAGVPYKYECPLRLTSAAKDARGRGSLKDAQGHDSLKDAHDRTALTIYPDFTCLNLRTRQEFLWEHFGRMDDPDYSKKTVRKLRTYRKNGFVLGKNLLVTMECDGLPLDRKEVEILVKTFLR